ncbi:MAG: glucosaminidase domain-containing protein [Candidatus Cloacimonetes bacterium]|nr:glucosaminidase domain-containing protein [Candidatus Cloacimonadota bacterium]
MLRLPLLPTLFKMGAFFAWGATSLFVLFSAFYLISASPELNISVPKFFHLDPSRTYHLFASVPEEGQVLGQNITGVDARPAILKNFLEKYRSPLAPYAEKFIEVADQNQLPWTLLPAICGKESGFGKVIPAGSFNPFGWAVYTGASSGTSFASWDDAIQKVGRALRRDYFDKGLTTLDAIEMYYTPLSASSHHAWRDGVAYFIWELENWGEK